MQYIVPEQKMLSIKRFIINNLEESDTTFEDIHCSADQLQLNFSEQEIKQALHELMQVGIITRHAQMLTSKTLCDYQLNTYHLNSSTLEICHSILSLAGEALPEIPGFKRQGKNILAPEDEAIIEKLLQMEGKTLSGKELAPGVVVPAADLNTEWIAVEGFVSRKLQKV